MAAVNNDIIIGIDYGTTQTTACYYDTQTNEVVTILERGGMAQYSSVLAFSERTQDVLFGNAASNAPDSCIVREVKRFVGKNYFDIDEDVMNSVGSLIEESEEGKVVYLIPDPRTGEDIKFSPEELVAIQLGYIKSIVKQQCADCTFSKVLMTVPSSFSDSRIDSMKYAYELAGIDFIEVMKEPSAALFEYKYLSKSKAQRTFVLDIGGGTTDCCVCLENPRNPNHTEIKGNIGDSMLGGSDFDKIMIDMILDLLDEAGYQHMDVFRKVEENKREPAAVVKQRTKNLNRLKIEAEKAKKHLSKHDDYQVDLETLLPRDKQDENIDIVINRNDYEDKIRESGLLERIDECIEQTLKASGMQPRTIQTVLLVGGVTYMPIIRDLVSRKFGANKIANVEGYDAMTAVAKGACRYCHQLNILHDVEQVEEIPMNIGVEGRQGLMQVFAKKGDKVPLVWDSRTMERMNAASSKAVLKFYKGESKYCVSNEWIADYEITAQPNNPNERYIFHVEISATGDMTITARELSTNRQLPKETVQCSLRPLNEQLEIIKDRIRSYYPPI